MNLRASRLVRLLRTFNIEAELHRARRGAHVPRNREQHNLGERRFEEKYSIDPSRSRPNSRKGRRSGGNCPERDVDVSPQATCAAQGQRGAEGRRGLDDSIDLFDYR